MKGAFLNTLTEGDPCNLSPLTEYAEEKSEAERIIKMNVSLF